MCVPLWGEYTDEELRTAYIEYVGELEYWQARANDQMCKLYTEWLEGVKKEAANRGLLLQEEALARRGGGEMPLIDDPAELAAHYGLPWPADACQCCGGRIIAGRCLGADRCHRGRCAGLSRGGD